MPRLGNKRELKRLTDSLKNEPFVWCYVYDTNAGEFYVGHGKIDIGSGSFNSAKFYEINEHNNLSGIYYAVSPMPNNVQMNVYLLTMWSPNNEQNAVNALKFFHKYFTDYIDDLEKKLEKLKQKSSMCQKLLFEYSDTSYFGDGNL